MASHRDSQDNDQIDFNGARARLKEQKDRILELEREIQQNQNRRNNSDKE